MIHRKSGFLLLSGLAISLVMAGTSARSAAVNEWPQFRGPDRTGVTQEKGLLKSWPAGGPHQAWKALGLGEGHAQPVVSGGKVYGLGLVGENEVVWALDASNGHGLWMTKLAPKIPQIGGTQGGYGPRSAPNIDGNRIYVEGVSGDLAALELASGKIIWHKNLVSDFGGRVPQWGYAECPLVDGNKLIATPGGHAATLVALNKMTGDVIWRAQVPEGDGAHYSSAAKAVIDGQPEYVQFLRGGVVGVSATDGKFLWRYAHPANGTANCSMPIVKDDVVFAASNYGTGGGAVRLKAENGGVTATELWFTKQMQNHHGGVVLVNGYLYGCDGSNLTCLDFKTGEVKWFNRSVGKGSVTCVDGQLYVRSERGPVALVDASPAGYMEHGRFDQPDRSTAMSWPYPVVAEGKLFLRDQDEMLCYDVRDPAAK
jgi:outer membrane protein assembly factor BamB